MQSQMEELEVRYKTELSRIKSKLQNELDEIRLRYESLKKVKSELENHLKKLQTTVKEAQDHLIEEQTAHGATRDLLSASEKRFGKSPFSLQQFIIHSISGLLHSEIEELRVYLDRVSYSNPIEFEESLFLLE
jgi:predicted nuclease with TOPRIM domain